MTRPTTNDRTTNWRRPAARIWSLLWAVPAIAQRGPAPDPLIREGATVKLGPHTYAIPDFNVGMVPNVGIVVGSRATLVVDTGLGRRNGEAVLREVAKVSKNTELYIVTTHFHAEHTMGYVAFPPSAKYVNAKQQEADFDEGGMRAGPDVCGRTPLTAELLSGATRRAADITFDKEHVLDLGGVRVRLLMVGPTHTKGDTVAFVEGDGVLFAGDVVMNNSFVVGQRELEHPRLAGGVRPFAAMKPRRSCPRTAHRPRLDPAAASHRDPRDSGPGAGSLKAQGKTADDTATTVQDQVGDPTWGRATAWRRSPEVRVRRSALTALAAGAGLRATRRPRAMLPPVGRRTSCSRPSTAWTLKDDTSRARTANCGVWDVANVNVPSSSMRLSTMALPVG